MCWVKWVRGHGVGWAQGEMLGTGLEEGCFLRVKRSRATTAQPRSTVCVGSSGCGVRHGAGCCAWVPCRDEEPQRWVFLPELQPMSTLCIGMACRVLWLFHVWKWVVLRSAKSPCESWRKSTGSGVLGWFSAMGWVLLPILLESFCSDLSVSQPSVRPGTEESPYVS